MRIKKVDETNQFVPLHIRSSKLVPVIDKVKFSGRATIVFWKDGTKTVVKDVDRRDVESDTKAQWSGLALAICKKIYGTSFKTIFEECENGYPKDTTLSVGDRIADIVKFLTRKFPEGISTYYCSIEIEGAYHREVIYDKNGVKISCPISDDGSTSPSFIEIEGLNRQERNILWEVWPY